MVEAATGASVKLKETVEVAPLVAFVQAARAREIAANAAKIFSILMKVLLESGKETCENLDQEAGPADPCRVFRKGYPPPHARVAPISAKFRESPPDIFEPRGI